MTKPLLAARLAVVPVLLCALSGRAPAEPVKQLRVCGDPNNLPFSNEKLEGIENKIADVIAKDLGMTVAYTWWPHQRGLVKRVLNTQRCDVMLGIPKGYDPVLWTKPYYRTGYVIAYRKDRGLKIRSLNDPALKKLKIGSRSIRRRTMSSGSSASPTTSSATSSCSIPTSTPRTIPESSSRT